MEIWIEDLEAKTRERKVGQVRMLLVGMVEDADDGVSNIGRLEATKDLFG